MSYHEGLHASHPTDTFDRTAMIPEGFITSLLDRADIVDVVGRYVTLKKQGRNFMACCPFHKEKTPSFSVSPSKQIFKCFGCGKAGNAIGFLMDIERLDFPEAVRRLAGIYGLVVPEDQSPRRIEQRAKAKALSDFMKEAADFYTENLRKSTKAVDYLKAREITGETAARFGLGYSPDGWHGLQAVFPGERYAAPELLTTGLVLEKNGRRYDAFRDRIMFPIRSPKGTVIGFGARTMKGDEQPKYLNSPETPIYHKGSELYGLYEGRAAVIDKGRAIVCEGYMDVIQLSQAGFREAVAALGTSITPEHVKKLFKLTDSVYFSFDGDAAGRKAARRALEAALPVIGDEQAAHFVLLPPEHDPDSLIKAEGATGYERELEKALPLTEFLKSLLLEGKSLMYAEERAKLCAEAKPLILGLRNAPMLRLALMKEIAAIARLQFEDLERQWGGAAPAPARPTAPATQLGFGARAPGRSWRQGAWSGSWRRRPAPEPRIGVPDVRERMLQCFLAYPKLLAEFSPQIEEEFVTSPSPAANRIVEVWRAGADEEGGVANPAALLMRLAQSPDAQHYESLLAGELTLETPEEAARIELKRDFLDLELERTKARLMELGACGAGLGQLRALLGRRTELERAIAEAAQEERGYRCRAEQASRAIAFAAAEASRADLAYSENPKVRALQEHLFGRAAVEKAREEAEGAASADIAPPAVPAARRASSPFGQAPSASPFGAPPAAPAAPAAPAVPSSPGVPAAPASPAPSPSPFGAPPAGGFPARAAAPVPQASQIQANPRRSQRDAIAAALLAQAEKRAGSKLSDPDALTPAELAPSPEDFSEGGGTPVPDMPEGFGGMDEAEFAGLADEAPFAPADDFIPDADPDLGRRSR